MVGYKKPELNTVPHKHSGMDVSKRTPSQNKKGRPCNSVSCGGGVRIAGGAALRASSAQASVRYFLPAQTGRSSRDLRL